MEDHDIDIDSIHPALDHGFVRLVDTMGTDAAIVQAARTSYGKGTKTPSDDRGLIRYLMRHHHTTPFEMCEIKLHLKMPIFVARQWIRHRTASINEMSGRYSIMPDEFFVPHASDISPQSKANKQGRDGELPETVRLNMANTIRQSGEMAFQVYQELHSGWPWFDADGNEYVIPQVDEPIPDRKLHDEGHGMARELARTLLPLGTYTEFYWKIDLHNLFHFLRLRLDSHAQKEIRVFADLIRGLVQEWVPVAYEAFVDYRLEAETFSRMEVAALREIVASLDPVLTEVLLKGSKHLDGISARERGEFFAKLKAA